MKAWIISACACVTLTGCGHLYYVRNAQLPDIVASPNDYRSKRVVLTGWARDGFEASTVYRTREEAVSGRGDRIEISPSDWPWDTTDPFRFKEPFTYNVAKVRIEGAILYHRSIGPNPKMVDCVVVALSPVEIITHR